MNKKTTHKGVYKIMLNVWYIAKRELGHFFYSPIAYIVYILFFFLAGLFFTSLLVEFSQYLSNSPGARLEHSSLFRYYWGGNMLVVMILLLPAVTMPLLAEEKKTGTLELLLTKPVEDWQVVLGKFLGAFIQFAIMVAGTLLYVLILALVGKPDLGWIVTTYLGVLVIGACFLSLGLLASSLTSNQIIAVIGAFVFLLFFWLIGFFAPQMGVFEQFFSYMSLTQHFESFGKGLLDAKDIIFYISFLVVNLFITIRVVESHKWL